MQPQLPRRLAAILVADVVGSSRLIETDETWALSAIHEALSRTLATTAAQHGGRLIKTTGDGALFEFASPVEAVRCAFAVQESLNERAKEQPSEKRVLLRIGVNLGDVVAGEGGDLFGDGVNVAARLEGIADPGGVTISAKVHDELQGKLALAFEDWGDRQLKNIIRPVRVYALPSKAASRASQPERLQALDRPSIAVLPFTNMSGDPEQEYFADGITEDLLTSLSRIRWLLVIARNSSFVFKGRAVDIQEVKHKLNVQYVLEGSIRKVGSRIRITAQLIEAQTGSHLWADRYNRDFSDIFDLQDEITHSVVWAIEPNIQDFEIKKARSKPTRDLSAYDLYLQSLPELHRFTIDGFRAAEALLRSALSRDPDYADAWAGLADCLGRMIVGGWVHDLDRGREEAWAAALCAVKLDPNNGTNLSVAAWALAVLGGALPQALNFANQALQLHPNSAYVQTNCAWVLIYNGELERALENLNAVRRMSPIDPRAYITLNAMAAAHFYAGRFGDAIACTQRTLDYHPLHPVALRYMAAALAHMNRVDEARAVAQQLVTVQPNSTISRAARMYAGDRNKLYIDGLRKAGVPE